MTDSQLAVALNLNVKKNAEVFGYAANKTLIDSAFCDKAYELETNGLELMDDDELAALMCTLMRWCQLMTFNL